ncbi:hypothetical protein U1Q18_009778, partial [Sarracenia purpurea var. burkii]
MRNSKFRGSFGDLKQGKSGNVRSPNRYLALASPDLKNEVCFPSLPAAIPRAPTKDPRTAVKIGESSPSVMTSTGDYDHAEEGRRLEKLIVVALNRAKKGLSPLSQEEVNHFQTWLANYRAANAQNQSQIPRLGGSNLTSNPNLESEGAVVVSEAVKRETVLPFPAAFEGHKGNLEDAETDVEKIYEVTKPCSLDPEAMEKTMLEISEESESRPSGFDSGQGYAFDDPLKQNHDWDCSSIKVDAVFNGAATGKTHTGSSEKEVSPVPIPSTVGYCSVVEVPKGISVSAHDGFQIGEKGGVFNCAIQVLDKMPKPILLEVPIKKDRVFVDSIKSNVELSDWGEVEGEVDDPIEESEALSPVAEGLNGAWDCRIGKSKVQSGPAHNVLGKMPQRSTEKKGFVLPKEGKSAFSRSIDADRSSPQEKTDNVSKTMEDPQVLACLSTNQSGVPSPPLAFSFPENGFALRTTETGETKEGAVLGGSEIVSISVREVAGSVGSAKDEVEADEDGVGDSEIGSEVPSTLDDKVIFLSSGSYAPHMSLSPDSLCPGFAEMNEESFLENLGKQMVVNEGDQIAAHHMFGEMPQPIAAESVCRVEDTVEGKSEVGDEDTVPRGVEYNLALGGKQDDDMGSRHPNAHQVFGKMFDPVPAATNQASLQPHGPAQSDVLHKPRSGMNWARVVATGSK